MHRGREPLGRRFQPCGRPALRQVTQARLLPIRMPICDGAGRARQSPLTPADALLSALRFRLPRRLRYDDRTSDWYVIPVNCR